MYQSKTHSATLGHHNIGCCNRSSQKLEEHIVQTIYLRVRDITEVKACRVCNLNENAVH